MEEWVPLGADVMLNARTRLGLSRETVARMIHVSMKTYERWEIKGHVKRGALLLVVEALDLEVETDRPERVKVKMSPPDPDRINRMEAQVAEIHEMVSTLVHGDGEDEQEEAAGSG